MAQAKEGDTVQVHYTGKLEDGTVFDSSQGRQPLSFTVGDGQVIAGFDEAVRGMEVGQTRTTSLKPDEGYGDRRDDMVVQVGRDQLPDDVEPEVGQNLQLRLQDGQVIPVVITNVSDGAVTIDANHPLAGKTLVFDIELVEIQ